MRPRLVAGIVILLAALAAVAAGLGLRIRPGYVDLLAPDSPVNARYVALPEDLGNVEGLYLVIGSDDEAAAAAFVDALVPELLELRDEAGQPLVRDALGKVDLSVLKDRRKIAGDGIVVAVIMAVELLVVIWSKGRFDQNAFPLPPPNPEGYSNTKAVGELLFTNYLLAFEAAGVILLVAIIAAIALTLRKRTGAKRQNPSMQVRVQKDERVRLVKMDPEPRQGS